MTPWALVTPASRGIGFALARHLLKTTNIPIIATAREELDRTKEKLLNGLPDVDPFRLGILRVDVTDERTIRRASDSCAARFGRESYLHLAFAIPGVLIKPEKHPNDISAEKALEHFQINAVGPMLLFKHFGKFLPLGRQSHTRREYPWTLDWSGNPDEEVYRGLNPTLAIWASMSARVSSISDNRMGGWYSYRASKAALNQVTKGFDNYLRVQSRDAAMAVGLHPGIVKTELSRHFWPTEKRERLFEPEWVAERLVGLLTTGVDGKRIDLAGRGRCWGWDGKEIPP